MRQYVIQRHQTGFDGLGLVLAAVAAVLVPDGSIERPEPHVEHLSFVGEDLATAMAAIEPATKRMRTNQAGKPDASAMPPQTPPRILRRRDLRNGAPCQAIYPHNTRRAWDWFPCMSNTYDDHRFFQLDSAQAAGYDQSAASFAGRHAVTPPTTLSKPVLLNQTHSPCVARRQTVSAGIFHLFCVAPLRRIRIRE